MLIPWNNVLEFGSGVDMGAVRAVCVHALCTNGSLLPFGGHRHAAGGLMLFVEHS